MKNFNILIKYIQAQLGYPTMNLEFNEDEIKEYIEYHTLFEFSNFIPWKVNGKINIANRIGNTEIYSISIDKNIKVLEIDEVVYARNNGRNSNNNNLNYRETSCSGSLYNEIIDIGIDVNYNQIINSLNPIQSYRYIEPSKGNNYQHLVSFELNLRNDSMVVLNCVHDELSTVPNEHFWLLKKWALRDVLEIVIAARNNYESLETNIGTINLNIQKLESKLQELTSEINEAKQSFIIDKSTFEFM